MPKWLLTASQARLSHREERVWPARLANNIYRLQRVQYETEWTVRGVALQNYMIVVAWFPELQQCICIDQDQNGSRYIATFLGGSIKETTLLFLLRTCGPGRHLLGAVLSEGEYRFLVTTPTLADLDHLISRHSITSGPWTLTNCELQWQCS